MEFKFDVKVLCGDVISVWDGTRIYHLPPEPRQRIIEVIDRMGAASARAQGLGATITTASKLCMNTHSSQRLYLIRDEKDDRKANGIIKVGRKKLFLRDKLARIKEVNAMCVLDFYVHESCQRRGLGRRLFDFMVASEQLPPQKFAIDRPSHKFLSFLRKHFGLSKYTPQANKFVVFDQYFSKASPVPRRRSALGRTGSSKKGAGVGSAGSSTNGGSKRGGIGFSTPTAPSTRFRRAAPEYFPFSSTSRSAQKAAQQKPSSGASKPASAAAEPDKLSSEGQKVSSDPSKITPQQSGHSKAGLSDDAPRYSNTDRSVPLPTAADSPQEHFRKTRERMRRTPAAGAHAARSEHLDSASGNILTGGWAKLAKEPPKRYTEAKGWRPPDPSRYSQAAGTPSRPTHAVGAGVADSFGSGSSRRAMDRFRMPAQSQKSYGSLSWASRHRR